MSIDNNILDNSDSYRPNSAKDKKTKRSIIKPLVTAGWIAIATLFNTNAQQITKQDVENNSQKEKIYNVQNIPAENLKFKLSAYEFKNIDDAKNNLDEIVAFLNSHENKDIYLVDNIDENSKDYLIEVDKQGTILSQQPINYQSFTNAISGIRHVPNKANSWDRLEIVDFEKIDGVDYVKLKQNPGDKTSWLSTRWDQIFNYLKLVPGINSDEAAMKDVTRFNVKKEYNIDLDTSKLVIIPRFDPKNGQLSVEDVIYTENETAKGKIPGYVVDKKDAKNYEALQGHVLIQKDKEIWLPLSLIPKDIALQDFLSTEPKDTLPENDQNDEPNQQPLPPVTKPDITKEETPSIFSIGASVGYQSKIWNEKDNFGSSGADGFRGSDVNMDNSGLVFLGYLNLDPKHFMFHANAQYYRPGESDYIDNKTNKKIGTFTNNEINLDALAAAVFGRENIKGVLGAKYTLETENPKVNYDGGLIKVESDIKRQIIALEGGIELGSNSKLKAYIYGNYGIGREDKTDSRIDSDDREASKSDIKQYTLGANINIGDFVLLGQYNLRDYSAKQGFTQDKKQNIIDLKARYSAFEHLLFEAGYKNQKLEIEDRNFDSNINKFYAGVGVRW